MFGLDDLIASYSDGTGLLLVSLVAILLGLRHATDPDHLAAVTTLIAGGRERAGRTAARLGLAWGAGHAATLFAFGLPIVLFGEYLPERAQQAAETAVAALIVYLAVRLLFRWHNGFFHLHPHEHGERRHAHLHGHEGRAAHDHPHRERSAAAAFGIGLVHGMGGSAGVGVLIVASVESTGLSLLALALLAGFTAVSMTVLTTGLGATLDARPVRRAFNVLAPGLGALSLAFGVWYASAAWALAPFPF
jgi:ABC-type nickel/cobalt efflux system permease component RcnA